MMNQGVETALDFAEEYQVTHALYDALVRDDAVSSTMVGGLVHFSREDEGLVYDAEEKGFWSEERYAESPFPVIAGRDIGRAHVFPQSSDGLEYTVYKGRDYADGLDLFTDVFHREYDGLIVLRVQGDEPVVYDALEERFWDVEEYEETPYYAVEQVADDQDFLEMLDIVEDKVAGHETHCQIWDDSFKEMPKVIGAAADGEGLVVGRTGSNASADYMLLRVMASDRRYNWMEKTPTEIDLVERVGVEDVPNGNYAKRRQRQIRDRLIKRYCDRKGEVAAAFEDAFYLGPTTRLSVGARNQ